MKTKIEMPEIESCEAVKCVYNRGGTCHARGITVGDSQGHLCDTMWLADESTQRKEGAGVGACRSQNCAFNEDLECQAEGIEVAMGEKNAHCGTFSIG